MFDPDFTALFVVVGKLHVRRQWATNCERWIRPCRHDAPPIAPKMLRKLWSCAGWLVTHVISQVVTRHLSVTTATSLIPFYASCRSAHFITRTKYFPSPWHVARYLKWMRFHRGVPLWYRRWQFYSIDYVLSQVWVVLFHCFNIFIGPYKACF
jgi:hypothetical protein